jgi:hypothetical protein
MDHSAAIKIRDVVGVCRTDDQERQHGRKGRRSSGLCKPARVAGGFARRRL